MAVAWAQSPVKPAVPSALATLVIWLPFILKGFALNLVISFLAMALATLLGIGLGLMQISLYTVVRTPARFITHLFRNSPWLVILFVVMFIIPAEIRIPVGGKIPIPDWIKATFAFTLPVMGNISEIVRGAVVSIPTGQWESAEGLAFTRSQTLRWIILPQCVRRAIAPWMNWYALLTLSTPMASIFSVHEAVAGQAEPGAVGPAVHHRPRLAAVVAGHVGLAGLECGEYRLRAGDDPDQVDEHQGCGPPGDEGRLHESIRQRRVAGQCGVAAASGVHGPSDLLLPGANCVACRSRK
jgi:polar amino acid transport system permease protein